MRRTLIPLALCALSLALAACGRDSGPLPPHAYAPADTPYVIAALEPMPDGFVQAWIRSTDPALESYLGIFDAVIAKMESEGNTPAEAIALARALQKEVAGKNSAQIVADWGLSLSPRSALFGLDLAPVMRMEIADGDKFAAAVARLEAAAGKPLQRGRIDSQDYWYFSADEVPLRAVMALHGGHLVLGLVPVEGADSLLRQVLGLELPKRSLADSRGLEDFSKRFGFRPQGAGWVDTARLVALVTQPRSGYQQAYLEALDIDPEPLPAECVRDATAAATHWPGLAIGYTRADAQGYALRTLLRTPASVAKDLQTLQAPTPGLDQSERAGISLSAAIKLDALPALGSKWPDQFSAATADWECLGIKLPLALAMNNLREGLSNPALFMAGPSANSLHAMLTRIDKAADAETPTGEGLLLIGSPNPQGLLAMARQFVPPLADLRIELDAEPVALPAVEDMPIDEPVYAAASGTAIGIAVGEGARADLRAALAPGQRQPLLQLGYRGDFYARLMELVLADMPETDDEDEAKSRELMQAMTVSLQQIEHTGFELGVGDAGVHFDVHMRLKAN